jgi:hypothetical protein
MRTTLGTIAQLTVAAALAVGPLPASAGGAVNYAGTISSVDRARGSLVVRDVGPWQGGSPAPVTPRTITLTPATRIAVASRTWEGTEKFPGDYQELPADLVDLTEGAFVAVECEPAGSSCRALKLTVVRTDEPA